MRVGGITGMGVGGWVRVGGITGMWWVGEGRGHSWYGGGWVRVGGITGMGG